MDEMFQPFLKVDRFEDDLALDRIRNQRAGHQVRQVVRVVDGDEILDQVFQRRQPKLACLRIEQLPELFQDMNREIETPFQPFGHQFEDFRRERIDRNTVAADGFERLDSMDTIRPVPDGLDEFDAGDALKDQVGRSVTIAH